MRIRPVVLVTCLAFSPLASIAQTYEFGVVANVAKEAIDNDEVVYNRPSLRLRSDMATLSAAHILQHDLQSASNEVSLLREQIKIELYRRHLFADHAQRRQLLEPYLARMELEVANGLAECNQWPDEETARKLGELGGRIFQQLNEGIRNTLAATGGPTQMGAISSTFANPPLRLSMVPARQFEISTASSWLLQRAVASESEYGWDVMRNDQEVRLQGVYTIRVKRQGWYDYYKLTRGASDPQFVRRLPASLVPDLVLQPFEAIEQFAKQVVEDELVELYTPKFEFKDEPPRGFYYSLGNSMLESQGPSLNFQAFDSLVRVAMIRHYRVTTPSRQAFWNPILDRVTSVIREELEYRREYGEMTREKQDEFLNRVTDIYVTALTEYARQKGYKAFRQEVKGVKSFTILFQTNPPNTQRIIYYIPATAKIFAEILQRPVPEFKWRAAFTGTPVPLSAGNYYWSLTRAIDAAQPFDENHETIPID